MEAATARDGLVVLGVDTRRMPPSDARRFVQAHGITYPVVFDPNGGRRARAGTRVPGLPVTYVLNPQGRIVGEPGARAGERQRLQPRSSTAS